jgi:hypothetical protein
MPQLHGASQRVRESLLDAAPVGVCVQQMADGEDANHSQDDNRCENHPTTLDLCHTLSVPELNRLDLNNTRLAG